MVKNGILEIGGSEAVSCICFYLHFQVLLLRQALTRTQGLGRVGAGL